MHIKNLTLRNFRNYADETFSFGEGLNVLYGKNGQGKTNCAEAVFYLCTGTSPRTRRNRQLIMMGADMAHCEASVEGRCGTMTLAADIREESREIFINGSKITKNADLLGNLYCVFFSPRELRLIQDGPDERRRFMNVAISQMDRRYYTALARYGKILDQRNALLKSRDTDTVHEMLPVWDRQLCRYAAVVACARQDFITRLIPAAAECHAFLTDGEETLTIAPERDYGGTPEEVERKLYRTLSAGYERDMRLGYTVFGPHRDDMEITVNGKDARHYASQGQARTAALSMMLAEVEIFREENGEYPVLVLDDVMSELDLPRRRKLVGRTGGFQTLLTCTHAERVLNGTAAEKIRIEGGRVRK